MDCLTGSWQTFGAVRRGMHDGFGVVESSVPEVSAAATRRRRSGYRDSLRIIRNMSTKTLILLYFLMSFYAEKLIWVASVTGIGIALSDLQCRMFEC